MVALASTSASEIPLRIASSISLIRLQKSNDRKSAFNIRQSKQTSRAPLSFSNYRALAGAVITIEPAGKVWLLKAACRRGSWVNTIKSANQETTHALSFVLEWASVTFLMTYGLIVEVSQ